VFPAEWPAVHPGGAAAPGEAEAGARFEAYKEQKRSHKNHARNRIVESILFGGEGSGSGPRSSLSEASRLAEKCKPCWNHF